MASTHLILTALVLLCSTGSIVSQEYIIVENSTSCEEYTNSSATCITLDQLPPDSQQQESINVTFAPGNHVLSQRKIFRNVSFIQITGNNTTVITHQIFGSFDFRDIGYLLVENIEMIYGLTFPTNNGGIFISSADRVEIRHSTFRNNFVFAFLPGVLQASSATINIIECNFDSNTGGLGGVMSLTEVEMYTEHSNFTNNYGFLSGGVIYAHNSTVTSNSSTYTNNDGGLTGGVFFANHSTLHSIDSQFTSNRAALGGVIEAHSTLLMNTDCTFAHNKGNIAGAIHTSSSNATVSNCVFANNSATFFEVMVPGGNVRINIQQNVVAAGAIFSFGSDLVSVNTTFDSNNALHLAGAVYTLEGTASIEGGRFVNNIAEEGAAIYSMSGQVSVSNTEFVTNQASVDGVVTGLNTTLTFKDRLLFRDNSNGSLSITESRVQFQGEATFSNNTGVSGGAITSTQSTVTFTETSVVTVKQNKALYGGGLSLIESVLVVNSAKVLIAENMASVFGGAMYAVQTQIEFRSNQANASLAVKENKANQSGGGFYMISSQVQHYYKGLLSVDSNSADEQGGAFYLESNSKILIYKEVEEMISIGTMMASEMTDNETMMASEMTDNETMMVSEMNGRNVVLQVTNNRAAVGGAIYVADETNSGTLCRRTNSVILQPIATVECFLQTIQLYPNFPADNAIAPPPTSFSVNAEPQERLVTTYSNVILRNNMATRIPGAIFGGLLDRCVLNPLAELKLADLPNSTLYNAFDYFKLLIEFDGLVDYGPFLRDNGSYPDNIVSNITNSNVSELITSEAVQVCYCQNGIIDCNYTHPPVATKKGSRFTASLAAVDQVGNPVEANIISRAESSNGRHRLKEGQGRQNISNQCADIEYNVFAADSSAEIHIHADGPCGELGVSLRILEVTFLPCTCPPGFQPDPSAIECICSCDEQLAPFVSTCSVENETFNIADNVWIGLSNESEIGFIIQNCTFDYCGPRPVTITFNNESSVDEQCAFNRTGRLCGKCREGLSLVLGTSRCQQCSSFYVFLLVPFAVAGIALVLLILALNMTVSTGTVNGLVFYANILIANHSIFLPFNNFLTGFISWVNLDWGIETCFYQGMDAYGKLLLQLVFPTYLFLLMLIIIIGAEHSQRVSNFLSKRNPIAALSTLILLSYSKLLRTIIEALQHTTLTFPDGSTTVVWLLDATVPYFSPTHIPRFILASIIIVLGAIYTILLLFGQCFHFCSKKKLMKWVRKPKYNAFIDAYQAPFVPRHRYWVGLLLLIRIFHYLLSAFASPSVTILSVGCIVFFLLTLKLLNTKIYKLWSLDTLETSFLLNLGILTICTYYIRLTDGAQTVAANISMTIAFVTFLAIVSFHIYEYFVKNSKPWQQLLAKSKVLSKWITKMDNISGGQQNSTDTEQQVTDRSNEGHYRDTALELSDGTVISNESTEPSTQQMPQPPVITYTVIDRNGKQEQNGHFDQQQ